MFRVLFLSIAQLTDARVLRVLVKSLGVTLAIFVMVGGSLWWGTQRAFAYWTGSNAPGLVAVFAIAATVLAAWLVFRAVAILVIGLFADEVVEAVEARHYPEAAGTARTVPLRRSIAMGLRSVGRLVGVNLLLLPLYLILLATGVGTAALFLAANAWLLGRDLTDMVTARHLPPGAMRDWRKANRAGRFLLGLAGTGLFVVPGINILAPVLGAAMATHFFHRGRA